MRVGRVGAPYERAEFYPIHPAPPSICYIPPNNPTQPSSRINQLSHIPLPGKKRCQPHSLLLVVFNTLPCSPPSTSSPTSSLLPCFEYANRTRASRPCLRHYRRWNCACDLVELLGSATHVQSRYNGTAATKKQQKGHTCVLARKRKWEGGYPFIADALECLLVHLIWEPPRVCWRIVFIRLLHF